MPTREQFASAIGDSFQVMLEPDPVTLQLQELDDRGDRSTGDAVIETYSLLFVGPSDMALPQSTYRFAHDDLGEFDMFIVPVGNVEKGLQYQAVFN